MATNQKRYFRLDKADRVAIERGLDAGRSARAIAADLGRSPATVTAEVSRNRFVTRGPGKGGPAGEAPADCCPRLLSWPRACNGCNRRRYHCTRKWMCEYSAARAQQRSDEVLRDSRRGVDRGREELEAMMAAIRSDVARGLSPAQIAAGRSGQFRVSASTVYRWIAAGYGGMADVDLRRKVGYKPRARAARPAPTPHGADRSHAAFMGLGEEERGSACEMDTVIGRKGDSKCLLTLYLRPCRFQLALVLPRRSPGSVAAALDMLEGSLGRAAFRRMLGTILTDNGAEFSDFAAIEASASGGERRCRVYYCDVRQSQQKGACERNHVELRKLLPKGRGISFDGLDAWDAAVVMSQLNSEPRPSLAGMTPIAMLRAAYGGDADRLLASLGVAEVPYGELDLSAGAVNAARRARGLGDLI